MCDISDRPRYKFKKHPFVSLIDDPLGEFSQILQNVLHIEDVRSYIHCKFKSVGDEYIHKDLGFMCNGYLTLKSEYAYLNKLNLIKHVFYTKFGSHECRKIILSKVHEEMFWIGGVPILIDNDLIHKVIGLRNEGCNPINDRNVRNIVEINLMTKFDGKNMRFDPIQDNGVRVLRKIARYKLNHSYRVNSVLVGFLHVVYVMVVEKNKVSMCEIIRVKLLESLAKLKKTKNVFFRFESLLTQLSFHATK